MKTKKKGSRLELELKHKLEDIGYDCIKAGGSFGRFDLMAINQSHILLIQVKANRISPSERERIAGFNNHPENCYKLIAVKKNRKEWIFKILCLEEKGINEKVPLWLMEQIK